MVIGTLFVLMTWALVIALWIAVGYALAGSTGSRARRGMWWGSALFTSAVLIAGVMAPLRSAAALGIVGLLLFPFITAGVLTRLKYKRRAARTGQPDLLLWPLIAVAAIAMGYLAWAALGPVTNYDTGLYHLGAIRYAGDFATIPGLANLYFPFGYNTAQFPLGAFLGNGPWQGEGFRLLNGLLLCAMVVDLVLRYRSRSVGTFILAVGVVVTMVPMVALDDYWVTSPTADTAVMIVTIVSVAYLADGLTRRRAGSADLAVAMVLAVITVTLRPLMAVYAIGVLLVVVFAQRYSARRLSPRSWLTVLGIAAVLGVIQSVRDYLLSGWLQFPLSVFAFDVPWRTADPVSNRTPTLGAARDPLDLWAAAEGWGWIGTWMSRLPSQWEPFLLALMILVAALLLIPVRSHVRWRVLVAVLAPALLVDIVWFLFSPPSFRFAWGPLFAPGIVLIGFALHTWFNNRQTTVRIDVSVWAIRGGALAVLVITVVTALFRSDPGTRSDRITWQLGPITLALPATPIVLPEVREQELASGLVVTIPTPSDQCWVVYPLCTAQLAPTVQQRGTSIGDGFIPG